MQDNVQYAVRLSHIHNNEKHAHDNGTDGEKLTKDDDTLKLHIMVEIRRKNEHDGSKEIIGMLSEEAVDHIDEKFEEEIEEAEERKEEEKIIEHKKQKKSKRYMGYFGENLMTLYFFYHQENINIRHTGCIMLV